MTTLDDWAALAGEVDGLSVVATLRAAATIQSSLVNAGVLPHPVTGQRVLAFVTYGRVKLTNLRVRPTVTATVQAGWRWAAVEGRAELIGPDDPHTDVAAERLRLLLREIFRAAGGSHDDWATYDRTMVEQRRTAVLVDPVRAYSNG